MQQIETESKNTHQGIAPVPAVSRINDFAFKLANVNGTGSASANGLIMQAIFRMGIPVTGKNLFPSNIQGLPTWYEIRVNKDGYGARALDYDLMVAMNSQTYKADVREVRSGGYLLYDSTWPLDPDLHRGDITFLRQDFSLTLQVPDPPPGAPAARTRFDYFVRTRDATDAEKRAVKILPPSGGAPPALPASLGGTGPAAIQRRIG